MRVPSQSVATVNVDAKGSILPEPLQKAAAELAEASGISLDQFIAAAMADKVEARRTEVGTIADSPIVATVRRDGLLNCTRRVIGVGKRSVRRNVRRAAIVKKRSAKFPIT
jgi:hypothetical protein